MSDSIVASFNISDLHSNEVTLQEKVSSVVFSLNGINILQQIVNTFNELKTSKTEAVGAYESLSNILREELTTLIEEIYQLKLKVIELEKRIDFISSEIKQHAASSNPSKSLDTCEEYKNFLRAYETSLGFSQDIVKKNLRIEVIVETQKLLDSSYASKMGEIDFQIIKLSKIIDDFQENSSSQIAKTYHSEEFSYCKQYKQLILEKDKNFDKIKEEFGVKSSGFYPQNPFNKQGANSIDSIFANHADEVSK